jgi:hypothetical protein
MSRSRGVLSSETEKTSQEERSPTLWGLRETTHVVDATIGHLRLKFSSRFHEGEEVPNVL